jgi:hypothetical protein
MIIVLVIALLVMVDQFRFRGYTSMLSGRALYYVTRLLPGRS